MMNCEMNGERDYETICESDYEMRYGVTFEMMCGGIHDGHP